MLLGLLFVECVPWSSRPSHSMCPSQVRLGSRSPVSMSYFTLWTLHCEEWVYFVFLGIFQIYLTSEFPLGIPLIYCDDLGKLNPFHPEGRG